MRRRSIREWAIGVLIVAFLAGLAGLFRPAENEPLAWTPPAAPALAGPYAPNQALAAAEHIPLGGARGPEDVAFGPDGALYTGVADGRILRRRPGGPAETFVTTSGRPLGLRFAPDGQLMVADAQRGLLGVSPAGAIEEIAREFDDIPFGLTDDLDVAADGTVYFTDASSRLTDPSTRLGLGASIRDLVEQHPTGRLLAYRRGEGLRLMHDDLYFANGVALAADESYVVVVETARYRLQRCWLQGPRAGTCEIMAENLPGFPDGVSRDARGTFWVSLVSPRNALLDRIHPYPEIKRGLLRLPEGLRPGPRAYGFVLGLDERGGVAYNLQDPSGRACAFVTNVVEHDGYLHLGSLDRAVIARVPRP
jgi:sugar lactone lactonase YvrE